MFKRLRWFAALTMCSAAMPGTQCSRVTVSADPEYPPFAWYDGTALRGASVGLVKQALEAIRLPYQIVYEGPFARVLQYARVGRVDIITELKDTSERQAFLVFSKTPIFSNPSAVFIRADQNLTYREWSTLIPMRGGVTNGTKLGGGFDEYAANKLHLETALDIQENFAKLGAHRIDYFVSPYYPAMSYLYANRHENDFKAMQPYIAEASAYVGWSKRSPCLDHKEAFDAELRNLVANGVAKRSVSEAFKAWRESPDRGR